MTTSHQTLSSAQSPAIESALHDAIQRLQSKGLYGQPGDSISFRFADRPEMLLVESPPTSSRQTISLRTDARLTGKAEPIHGTIYRQRADVGVVIITHPHWGSRLARLNTEMPAIFDEQIRQLGPAVSRWSNAKTVTKALLRGDNAFVEGDAVICMGASFDRAVFNLELLEKCAKSFVLAHLTGQPVGHIPRWVQWIAGGRLKKDERHAAEAFARGEYPSFVGSY